MRTLDPQDPALTYAAVLDALPIVAFMANSEGAVTYVSRGWERFTGIRRHDVLERGYRSVIYPDDLAHVVSAWAAACAEGIPYRSEFRLLFGDGAYRWVVSQADPLHGPGDAVIGWFGSLTGIHELRVAEDGMAQALQAASASALAADERAHFVERLLDANDDCVKVLDLDARLVSMSANGRKALAIKDFSSVDGADWLGFWSGDDRLAAEAAVDAARAGQRGRFTGLFAVDGREKWWDVSVTAILDRHGNPERLLAVSREITDIMRAHRELARSEERYRVLSDTLPGVAWTATPDGMLDHIGGPGSANRPPAAERLGDGWLRLVHPDDRDGAGARWRAAVERGTPYESQFRVRMADGGYRWMLVRALPQRDETGAVLRWVGVNVDIEDERRAAEARELFVRLVEASDDFIGIVDVGGAITYVNEAGRRLLEIGSIETARGTKLLDYFAPDDRGFVQREILPAIAREGRWQGEYRFRNFRTGATVPVAYNAFSLPDDTGRPAGIAIVSHDLRERRRVEAGMRALAEAGAAMYGSLDFAGTVKNVADAVVRSFATICAVDALEGGAIVRSISAAPRHQQRIPALERAAAARSLLPDHPVTRAIYRGESTFSAALPPDWLATAGGATNVGDVIRDLDLRSLIVVPIPSAQDGGVIGALACSLDGRDPRGGYTPEDVRFAEEVAVRAGVALDHARAYERERRIAVTLAEASLPGTLPAVERLRLAAAYRPGNSEATIGGDWYDAFLLDDGRVVITIGDVLGNGLQAAVTMGKLRQAMQSVALVLPDPNTMLDAADRTVRAQSDDTYATALAGIFDRDARTFTFASAGHPGPALRRPDGRIEEFASPSLLLGLRQRNQNQIVTVSVRPGSALVFYTDGLVEATRDMREGQRRLHAAMTAPDVLASDHPAQALVEHVLGGRPATDDIAVLVAEVD